MARLKAYAGLLADWNPAIIWFPPAPWKISGGGISGIPPSLAPLIPPNARTLADLGSGAGFPGLVLAEMLRGRVSVTLLRSHRQEMRLSDAAAERMDCPSSSRIAGWKMPRRAFDVVTARACAPCPSFWAMHRISQARTVFACF